MPTNLHDMRILMIVEDQYEDLELWYPKLRLMEEGIEVVVAGPRAGRMYAGKHGYPAHSDIGIGSIKDSEYDGLVLPGGFAPDRLRRDEKVKSVTRAFHKKGKLLAHVCHAGWILISAGVIDGFKCTSTPGIRDDLVNAGGIWEDEPVVIDRHQVSSRGPNDLPYFCKGIIQVLQDGAKSSK